MSDLCAVSPGTEKEHAHAVDAGKLVVVVSVKLDKTRRTRTPHTVRPFTAESLLASDRGVKAGLSLLLTPR